MKRHLLLILVLILTANFTIQAQNQEEEPTFVILTDSPEYPGGMNAMTKYLKDAIVYPQEALNDSIEGRVFVSFVIEKDGRISKVKVLRNIGGICGHETARAVLMMPPWKPGEQQGKKVRTQFILPVYFMTIDEKEDDGSNKQPTLKIKHTGTIVEGALLAPEYFGGDKQLLKYLGKRIGKKLKGNTTPVSVRFYIAKDGKISNVEVFGGTDKQNKAITKAFSNGNL